MPDISISLRKQKKLILGNARLSLSIKLSELTERGGTGIALFFIFLKYATITFFFMTLVSLRSISIFYNDKALTKDGEIGVFQYEKHLAKFSIANLEVDSQTNNNIQKVDSLILVDIAYVLLFTIFIWRITSYSKKLKKQKKLLPSMYALEVKGFPSSVIDAQEIKDHFTGIGYEVEHVYLARNYRNTLFYHKDITDLYRKMQEAKEIKAQKQQKGIKSKFQCLIDKFPNQFDRAVRLENKYKKTQTKLNNKINKILKTENTIDHNSYQSLKAYVIFSRQYIKNNAFKYFKKQEVNQTLLDCMPKQIKKCYQINDRYLFKGKYSLKVNKKVDEPSDIRWENIEISNTSRFFRSIFVFSLLVGFLILCLALIILVNLFKPSYTLDLCSDTKWKQANVDWNIVYPDIENKECKEAFESFSKSLFLSFLIGSFVLSINTILKVIIKSFSIFMRYTSISQEVKASTVQIFRAQFINTGLLIALLNFDFGGVKIPEILIYFVSSKFEEIENKSGTEYVSDFTRGFYINTGGKILLTMMINIISPLLYSLFGIRCLRRLQKNRAKKQKKQREMNRAMIPPEFDIATGYAVSLNTIFISLFYCTGIPLLIPIGFVALYVQYWSLKYRILRYNKKPPAYDSSLNKTVINILPLAIFLHLFMGMLMISEPNIFAEPNSGEINFYFYDMLKNQDTSQIQEKSQSFGDRFLHNYGYTLFFALVIFTYIFIKFLRKYYLKCKKFFKKKKVAPEQQNFSQWSYKYAYAEMAEHNIASYDICDNRLYNKLVRAINRGCVFDQQLQEELRLQRELEKIKEMEQEQNDNEADDDIDSDIEQQIQFNKQNQKNNNNNNKNEDQRQQRELIIGLEPQNNQNNNNQDKDKNNVMEQSVSIVNKDNSIQNKRQLNKNMQLDMENSQQYLQNTSANNNNFNITTNLTSNTQSNLKTMNLNTNNDQQIKKFELSAIKSSNNMNSDNQNKNNNDVKSIKSDNRPRQFNSDSISQFQDNSQSNFQNLSIVNNSNENKFSDFGDND